jgi:hypothetical protein
MFRIEEIDAAAAEKKPSVRIVWLDGAGLLAK